ncbi:18502_t:CDS:1 [Racocetra fulgida]|uniref:18502_t:CDS:1 n=1 Tax=Racocetra fulgida TaxID=60492 RepID=A0A9N9DSK9_9GLOM|nr:18502_t:CDS:1 [Racocetra fulgida]
MVNADDSVCCNYESTIYGPPMKVSTTPLIAGQKNIMLNITGVFEQDIITETKVYIELVANDYSSSEHSAPTVYSDNLQICKNNVPCPVPAGKYVEVLVALKIPDDIAVQNLDILSYIGYVANNNVFVIYGCSGKWSS